MADNNGKKRHGLFRFFGNRRARNDTAAAGVSADGHLAAQDLNTIDAARDLDIDENDIIDNGAADDDGAVHMQHVPPQISTDNERQAVAERVDSEQENADNDAVEGLDDLEVSIHSNYYLYNY